MKKMDNFGGPTVHNKITLDLLSRERNHFLEIFWRRRSNRDSKRFKMLERKLISVTKNFSSELSIPTTQFLFRSEISQKWPRHLKRQKRPRQRLPLEAVKSRKRSGPRVKPGTNFQICAFSINQPTIKFLKKYQTTRFKNHPYFTPIRSEFGLKFII